MMEYDEFDQPRLYHSRNGCDPRLSARELKKVLEADEVVLGIMGEVVDEERSTFSGFVKVFDPNADNAFLMAGDWESANTIWLRNWRDHLEYARRTGGAVIQLVVDPGLSEMQIAEESMAADKGVRIVKIDTREPIEKGSGRKQLVSDFLSAGIAMMHPEVKVLRDEAARARAGTYRQSVPLSRRELEDQLASVQVEMLALQSQVVKLTHGDHT